jgi:demethylmenaquinone methyltransferase/2-methoxy-6-polyprenyl-1,4-benzoquinol methylase
VTNKFYASGEQRAAKVNELFTAIAARYDLINDLQSLGLHRLWKRRLLRLAKPQPGEHAIDLCCGTGDIALKLAGCGADTVGLDFTENMLAVAGQRLAEKNERLPNGASPLPVKFIRGDALKIPFPDASFDIVTVGYGLRNLSDLDAGLREMQRNVRPGGRVLILDFGKPDNAIWRGIYFSYLRHIVPLLGWLFSGDRETHGYILESLNHYAGQKGVASRMEALGLAQVRIINLLGGIMSINYAEKPPLPLPGTASAAIRQAA